MLCCPTMPDLKLQRRAFLTLGASAFIARHSLYAAPDAGVLDTFIARYMKAMNAPGMTLALARREGPGRIATFGYSRPRNQGSRDARSSLPGGLHHQIFCRLDLPPVARRRKTGPGAPHPGISSLAADRGQAGTITPHHLLTHTSGLPNALGFMMSDPGGRYVQAISSG